jgi:hypothetical protein
MFYTMGNGKPMENHRGHTPDKKPYLVKKILY